MTTERSLLMIADIGGYTTYMRTHRMSLAHAEVNTTRLLSALAITLLCGAAVAAVGPIAFVGLVVPHMMRVWFGPDQRWRFVKEQGMPSFTPQTLTSPEALDADLTAGERRGLHLELNQFRVGAASAALLVLPDREQERRVALACVVPASELMPSAKAVRESSLSCPENLSSS